MAEAAFTKVVILGGRGSPLSSSSVYRVATGHARVTMDPSVLNLLVKEKPFQSLQQSLISIPPSLTALEARASLTFLLNRLLLCCGFNPSSISSSLPHHISETLNLRSSFCSLGMVSVTEEEKAIIQKSASLVNGICTILDHEATALSSIIDAVAALSCEAVRADVTEFHGIDSGDGFVHKENVAVAADLKTLLAGSKLVGKTENKAFSDIPEIHGELREMVKQLHAVTRVALNSRFKTPAFAGTEGKVGARVSALATVLVNVGEGSLSRAKLNINAVENETLRSGLWMLCGEQCSTEDNLRDTFLTAVTSYRAKDHVKFVHEAYMLLDTAWRIVTWEGITAFVALEGGNLGQNGVKVNAGDVGRERGKEKKSNKKVVLGKGSCLILQLIKDRLNIKEGDSDNILKLLQKWVDAFFVCFNPKAPEFDELADKVKDILDSNESRRLPKIPKGTRDFSGEQMVIREKAFQTIVEVFKRHGAAPLDTPAFELRETLMGKYGEDSKLIYDLADQGGEHCSLRYDLTVPFARFVAMNGITSFKRYHIGKVYRRDNPSKGRYREFYQCDFDIAGHHVKMGPDFETIKILTELLDELNIGEYEVKLNHRKLLDGILDVCEVPSEKFRTICSSIDKLDKLSMEQVKHEMIDKGLEDEKAEKICLFISKRDSPKILLSRLKHECSQIYENSSARNALDELEVLFEALEKAKCIEKLVFDLSLARGLDYYTGVIFEATFKGSSTQVGSIAAGGRYDNLIGSIGAKPVPAVGVSLGIERVLAIMEQIQKDSNQVIRPSETQVLLSILGDSTKLPLAAEMARELWDANLKAEFIVNTRFSKHMDYARQLSIPWMVLVGDKELEKGIVKLKNIETALEEDTSLTSFAEELRKRLNL